MSSYLYIMVIFPIAPDQTIAQMWSSGARGGAINDLRKRLNACVLADGGHFAQIM